MSIMGTGVGFLDSGKVEEVVRRRLCLEMMPYDKMFKDYDGTDTKFYPDNYVTIIGSGQLGNTW